MVPLLYPLPRTKSPWPEDSREFSEGLLSGYRISVYYMPIPVLYPIAKRVNLQTEKSIYESEHIIILDSDSIIG